MTKPGLVGKKNDSVTAKRAGQAELSTAMGKALQKHNHKQTPFPT